MLKTFIRRNRPSLPLRYLLKNQLHIIRDTRKILDYGCGYGTDVEHLCNLGYNAFGYDPHMHVNHPIDRYDVILCTYVLNVIPDENERRLVLWKIKNLFWDHNSIAYITVRRDRHELTGFKKNGGWQGYIQLDHQLSLLTENSKFAIYYMTAESDCVISTDAYIYNLVPHLTRANDEGRIHG